MTFSSFMLQYAGVSVSTVAARAPSLFITEGAPFGRFPAITDGEVATLQGAGTTVVGYVNVAVTDDTRPYWNPDWTEDETDRGALTDLAPSWLVGQPKNCFGRIADYDDPAWRQIVIDQAVELVSRGYGGVFLDDVGIYFTEGSTGGPVAGRALKMMAFVTEIAEAIRAVDPGAVLVVNSTPYIPTDATGGPASATAAAFLDAVDAMLFENYFGLSRARETAAIDVGITYILPHMDILALESEGGIEAAARFLLEAEAAGFAGFASFGGSYATAGYNRVDGIAASETLGGSSGQDIIFAGAGHDIVNGGDGADLVRGEDGSDRLSGGRHADILAGGAGGDTLKGGKGDDTLVGGRGNDRLSGGDGDDVLAGGQHADVFVFDAALSSAGTDRITDFGSGNDRIELSASVFAGLAPGALAGAAFVVGAAAADANDRIIHNASKGTLWFDADGSGAGAWCALRPSPVRRTFPPPISSSCETGTRVDSAPLRRASAL
ncbi:endo alpha-1,4 polygalactosaminidase [Methylobrevis pamukkalensis]|uniref:Hemolysin, chromosomal n=1 Tax=Methylobrevis pamukkalensis TaxID=1439726 RepID=A0A1E3H4P7_9HYPH|nr:endo alpha-1,4 polygalactosaminidase [Methylobrevis pamukkalensis]ODN71299.1 Hemolysin, chromosomal [Methylobrevis pamukkalensis]